MDGYYGFSTLLNIIHLAVCSVFYFLYGGVTLFNNFLNVTHENILVERLTLFPVTTIAPNFTYQKNTTDQTTGYATLTFSYLILNQGSKKKLVILTCFWYILWYGPINMKEAGVGNWRQFG